jgi:putative lipoprotein
MLACVCLAVLMPMSAAADRVSGTATKRDRMALPPDAVFEARVEDVSLADARAVVIGSVRIEGPGQVPISFAIDVDPKRIDAANSYAVRATITIDGRLRYTTDTRHPVLTRGAGTHVDIVLRPVQSSPDTGPAASAPGGASTQPPKLEDTHWKLTELAGKAFVAAPDQMREAGMLLHEADRRVSFSGGCNQMTASYVLHGAHVTFGKAAGTLMACPSGMDTDQAFSEALSTVRSWKILGQALELSDAQGQVLARFAAGAPKP